MALLKQVLDARGEIRFSFGILAFLGIGTLVAMFLLAVDGNQIRSWIGIPATLVLTALNALLFMKLWLHVRELNKIAIKASEAYCQEALARRYDAFQRQLTSAG